jgi:hypothetical protein
VSENMLRRPTLGTKKMYEKDEKQHDKKFHSY